MDMFFYLTITVAVNETAPPRKIDVFGNYGQISKFKKKLFIQSVKGNNNLLNYSYINLKSYQYTVNKHSFLKCRNSADKSWHGKSHSISDL